MSKYHVLVDDNFHYMDEKERRELGAFATLEDALAACRALVDHWLVENHKPGMTGAELYSLYSSFGEDPFILSDGSGAKVSFSARDYAKLSAEELCRPDVEAESK
jgi:hypothetical protein